MTDLQRVLVLAGGFSHERDVSLHSGRRVVDALAGVGIEAHLGDTDPELLAGLRHDPPDAVFIALHGGAGEDGSLRGILELLGVPYVGADAQASRLAYDKPSAKAAVAAAGLAVAHGVVVGQNTLRELGAATVLDRLVTGLGSDLVVKPTSGGSAMGMSIVDNPAGLATALAKAYSYGDAALVEQRVAGTEIAVSVVDTGDGPHALPAVEVVPRGSTFDYAAHYTAGATDFHVPARLAPEHAAAAAAAAITAHRALDLRDLSRTDFIITAAGVPTFLEVSVSPGLTETSTLAMAARAAGYDLGALYRDLLQEAMTRAAASAG